MVEDKGNRHCNRSCCERRNCVMPQLGDTYCRRPRAGFLGQQLYALPTGDCQRRCAYMMVHLITAAAPAEGVVKDATGQWPPRRKELNPLNPDTCLVILRLLEYHPEKKGPHAKVPTPQKHSPSWQALLFYSAFLGLWSTRHMFSPTRNFIFPYLLPLTRRTAVSHWPIRRDPCPCPPVTQSSMLNTVVADIIATEGDAFFYFRGP